MYVGVHRTVQTCLPCRIPLCCPQAVGRFFQVRERNSSLTQELRGGAVSPCLATCCPGERAVPTQPRVRQQRPLPVTTPTTASPLLQVCFLTVAYILAVNANSKPQRYTVGSPAAAGGRVRCRHVPSNRASRLFPPNRQPLCPLLVSLQS